METREGREGGRGKYKSYCSRIPSERREEGEEKKKEEEGEGERERGGYDNTRFDSVGLEEGQAVAALLEQSHHRERGALQAPHLSHRPGRKELIN